jgi:integrase
MPADQRGQVYATKTAGFGIRWRDAAGVRHRKAGFAGKREARAWLRDHLDSGLRVDRITFAELAERYRAAHAAGREPNTMRVLRERLARPVAEFGDVDMGDLERRVREIAEWQATLPAGSRYGIVQAFRQTLDAGVRWGYLRTNPAKLAGRNVQPRPPEVVPLTEDELAAIVVELGPTFGPMVRFAAESGLRPEEWIALERRDVDRQARVAQVARTYCRGRLKAYGKTHRSLRRVPLTQRALAALDELPPRLDTPLVFPGHRGGHLDLHNFRARDWHPAVEAAGIERRVRIYDLRHTFVSNALAAGLSTFEVARFAGTSVQMIDRTYGHLVASSEDTARERLDVWATSGPRAAASVAPEGP